MDRTNLRGISAAILAALTSGAVVGGSAIANGAVSQTDYTHPLPLHEQLAAITWHLPRVPGLRPLRPRHHRHRRSALSGSPQTMARTLLTRSGGDAAQWSCLDELWTRESGWSTSADNASSGAYGIPQALPATKMASAGSDWRTNPLTQIRWGLGYIAASYGTPCNALAHSNAYGYY